MRPTYIYPIFLVLIISCVPLQQAKDNSGTTPSLGVIGKEERSLLGKEFQQLGNPHMTRTLALSSKEIPFTKSKFKTYQQHSLQRIKQPIIQYTDSLPKPSYIRLEISDKIALQAVLNQPENSDVRSYLAQDMDYGIVTGVSMVLDSDVKELILEAEALFLSEAEHGQMTIALVNHGGATTIPFPKATIFDYTLSGCCWVKDQYGKKKIEAIAVNREQCPKGTEQKAYKLDATKSYLKLK